MVEASFLAAVASPFRIRSVDVIFPYLPLLVFNWFIFRLMLAAGFVKWFGSDKWRKLTAMDVHYWTQPIPNPMAYYMSTYVPSVFHKFGVVMSLFIEIPLPFLVFIPWWPLRLFTFVSFVGLMVQALPFPDSALLATDRSLSGNDKHNG